MSDRKHKPILMIGLDAAEISLIEQWMDDGTLKTLGGLRDRGIFGPLTSTASWLVGSPWPSFYTGTPPEDHGLYHYLIWKPQEMTCARPAAEWLPAVPFWRQFSQEGPRVLAIDIPMVYSPSALNGIEISGWATHEQLEEANAFPEDIKKWLAENYGESQFENEATYLLSTSELLRIRDRCISTTNEVAKMAGSLLERADWDLALVCFSAPHRAGHQLWDLTNVKDVPNPAETEALQGALKNIYRACDRAIAELMAAAGPESTTIVFALHGMGPNTTRSDILNELLSIILADEPGSHGPNGKIRWLEGLRDQVPATWRSWVKNRLPLTLQDQLTNYWRTGGTDWASTPAFAVLCDLDGYIRVNLRGREAEGIVEPGADYERLCTRIAVGLETFRDEDTGEPIVQSVRRRDELFPNGQKKNNLPDLIVQWSASPAARHRRIFSKEFGAVNWPTPGRHPQGRSGNHRATGFLCAAGDQIVSGTTIKSGHILDLAPTVLTKLGATVPPHMRGRPLF